jgi:hypothetical protein
VVSELEGVLDPRIRFVRAAYGGDLSLADALRDRQLAAVVAAHVGQRPGEDLEEDGIALLWAFRDELEELLESKQQGAAWKRGKKALESAEYALVVARLLLDPKVGDDVDEAPLTQRARREQAVAGLGLSGEGYKRPYRQSPEFYRHFIDQLRAFLATAPIVLVKTSSRSTHPRRSPFGVPDEVARLAPMLTTLLSDAAVVLYGFDEAAERLHSSPQLQAADRQRFNRELSADGQWLVVQLARADSQLLALGKAPGGHAFLAANGIAWAGSGLLPWGTLFDGARQLLERDPYTSDDGVALALTSTDWRELLLSEDLFWDSSEASRTADTRRELLDAVRRILPVLRAVVPGWSRDYMVDFEYSVCYGYWLLGIEPEIDGGEDDPIGAPWTFPANLRARLDFVRDVYELACPLSALNGVPRVARRIDPV